MEEERIAEEGAESDGPPPIPLAALQYGTPVTRVYGTILMVLYGVQMAVAALWAVAALFLRNPVMVFRGIIGILVSWAFYRLGSGLRDSERFAVYGVCAMAVFPFIALAVGTAIFGPFTRLNLLAMIIGSVAGVAVVYIPPIVSAFRHWDRFL